jgi:hypothetical protein
MIMKRHELILDHIKRIKDRYKDSSKYKKTLIVSEFCNTWGVTRKYIIKRLNEGEVIKRKAGRKSIYDGRLVEHLLILWDSMERICPKRMKAAIPIWLPFYKNPLFDLKLRNQILNISASTIERFLKRGRKTIKGMSATRRAKFFKYKIPLHEFTGNKIINAGHVCVDTVAHCGDSLSGQFVWSLTLTDRLTGWTENRAMEAKNRHFVVQAVRGIESKLPFEIKSLQSDCGTEFLNYVVMKYLHNRIQPITMTRSRPYHKNDNAEVEQKNYTHVRQLFGYQRISIDLQKLMNEIYEDYWNPLHNFFLPQMKLKEKERFGAKITKRYSFPMTPFQRLKLAPNLTEAQLVAIEVRYKTLNPFELKRNLEAKLNTFFTLLNSTEELKKVS